MKTLRSWDIHNPVAVVELPSEELLVLSRARSCIYKISKDGSVSLWVGSAGQNAGQSVRVSRDGDRHTATFENLYAAACDPRTGQVYICDGHLIRNLRPDGSVATIAGRDRPGYQDGDAPLAAFKSLHGITVDSQGNLLVSDTGNHRIRKVLLKESKVITVAGSSTCGFADGAGPLACFNTPGGLVCDPVTGAAYVCDQCNNCIRKITMNESGEYEVSVLSGCRIPGCVDGSATEAQYHHPSGITFLSPTHILVCDYTSRKLRFLSHGGVVQTATVEKPGVGVLTFQSPHNPCLTAQGRVVVPDTAGNRVYLLESDVLPLWSESPRSLLVNNTSASSLSADMWQMQQNGKMCDVEFEVDGKLIQAHSVVLAARSEYFAARFNSSWQSHSCQSPEHIVVDGTSASAFHAMLEYMYTDSVHYPDDIVPELLLLARRFLLAKLLDHCVGRLQESMGDTTAVKVCLWAHHNGVDEIKTMAVRYISARFRRIRLAHHDSLGLLKDYPEVMFEIMCAM